ncbi:glycoside hydrolase superfamily [Irpex rosettiformis]|uniref:Glycoside hydrolase superfamily n=1 Tax=Irpex rosettiformis TaxID=378272 RepID=A0ACB8UGB7_9APHY|nr:glycoside hydrolase superfamily [Irpex rosettiformis]
MAYYPEWAASAFPPENIDFARFDWIDFAFAVPTQNFGLGWDGDDDSADLLRRLVSAAHQNGKRVKLSVGGWTGSKYFSPAVSKPANRQTFVNSILAVYNQFALDGIDIDWEFPAEDGNKGNIKSPNDTANFLAFLQLLRKTLPQAAKISAATMTVPWLDPQGNPSRDVSKFAGVLDWILVMNYDTWGSSSVPGPNAPLSNACHNSTQSSASAVAAVMSWTSAGFPASKIVMGVPSYGYISRSGATNLMTRSFSRSKRAVPKHLPMHVDGASQAASIADSEANVSAVGEDSGDDPLAQMEGTKTGSSGSSSAFMVHNEDGGTDDGQVQFRDLVKQKVLQYLSAWSTSTRAAVAATVDDGESDDDSDGTQGDGGGGGAEQSNPEPSSNGDSGDSDDSGDPSQAGVTSIAFAGQQIINVFNGQNGFVRQWDACSSTPYLRSASARQVITYDDPQSLEMKAVFVRAAGLLGVNLFDIHGDTDKWDLTDGIRRGLGL